MTRLTGIVCRIIVRGNSAVLLLAHCEVVLEIVIVPGTYVENAEMAFEVVNKLTILRLC